MRVLPICVLTAVLLFGSSWRASAEEAETKKRGGLEKLLTTYLQNRVQRAQLALKHTQGLKDSGAATIDDVLAAEDEIDRCRLNLRLAVEAKLVIAHPVFGELRRELGVPEIRKPADARTRKLISAAILEYIEQKLRRAEKASQRASALYEYGRGSESEVLAAKSKVEGLKLLLEGERLALREKGE